MTQIIGYSQNPTFQVVGEPLDNYLFTFTAGGHQFCFERPGPGPSSEFELSPRPVPDRPHRLHIRNAAGEPVASTAIYFWPVLGEEEPFAHLSLGITDAEGAVREARLLPPGKYELYTTPGRLYTAFDPGEGGPPRYNYQSLGRITWPEDGPQQTIEVQLPEE